MRAPLWNAVFVLAALCAAQDTLAESATSLRAVLFIPLAKDDFSFSQAAYRGYESLRNDGYDIDCVENAGRLSKSQILSIVGRNYAGGRRAFIMAGNELSAVTTAAAKRYPQAFFATLSGNAQGRNVINYCLDCLSPGGYLAGKIALKISMAKDIGFVGGVASVDGPEAERFRQTILAKAHGAKVAVDWTNNWADLKSAQDITERQIKAGADVVLADANLGVITAADYYPNVKIIGWMVDVSPLSTNVTASVIINTDVVYRLFMESIATGRFKSGSHKAKDGDGIWGVVWAK
jgi:basic membrane protein A